MLLHDVVMPTLQSISRDPEPEVRKVAVETLVYVAEHCSPHWISSLVDLINQVGEWVESGPGLGLLWLPYMRTYLCIYMQVANLCVANDEHTSPESQMARRESGGVGGGHQDTKVALFGLVNLFKVRE